jgi:lipopolysaccharide export system protein LptA
MATKNTKNTKIFLQRIIFFLKLFPFLGAYKNPKKMFKTKHDFLFQNKVAISFSLCFFVANFFSSVQAQETNATAAPAPASSNPWGFNFGHQPRPQDARTVIDAQDGAWFDDTSNTVEFFGKVVVHDPQFTLTCDRLNVVMNKNRQGLQLVTATGNVNIEEQGTNDSGEKVKSVGKAEMAVYEPATGDITLKAWPQSLPEQWPQVRQGKNFQVATEAGTVMVLNSKGTFRTKGQTRTMILDVGEKEKSN